MLRECCSLYKYLFSLFVRQSFFICNRNISEVFYWRINATLPPPIPIAVPSVTDNFFVFLPFLFLSRFLFKPREFWQRGTEFLHTRGRQRIIKLPFLSEVSSSSLHVCGGSTFWLLKASGGSLLSLLFLEIWYSPWEHPFVTLPGQHRNAIVSSRNSAWPGFSLLTQPPLRPWASLCL